jgi:hypothetical protein
MFMLILWVEFLVTERNVPCNCLESWTFSLFRGLYINSVFCSLCLNHLSSFPYEYVKTVMPALKVFLRVASWRMHCDERRFSLQYGFSLTSQQDNSH